MLCTYCNDRSRSLLKVTELLLNQVGEAGDDRKLSSKLIKLSEVMVVISDSD